VNQKPSERRTTFFHTLIHNEQGLMALLAALTGLAGGFGAIGFRFLIDSLQGLSYGSGVNLPALAQAMPWYLKLWIPAAGGLVVGTLVYFPARESQGQGVPAVMEAVAIKQGIMGRGVLFVKAVAPAVTIGTGGSAGIQGPIVHIGSGLGSVIGQGLRVSGYRIRTLVGCGAAAGIAATFNAPIAGCMFALEIILGEFGIATFSPIVISSVAATAVSRHFLGDSPVFSFPPYQLISAVELPIYVLLGFVCAAVAVLFISVLHRVETLFSRLRCPEYFKPMVGGLGVGLIALTYPEVLGVGFSVIDHALMGGYPAAFMLLLLGLKVLATSLTLGSGGHGGVFFPALFLGAMAGGSFGALVHGLLPDTTASAGAYGMVAMGALVSGTTHGPISAILMLFEMTGNYRIILPLMMACIVSSITATQWLTHSIYTLGLAAKGVNLEAGREINVLNALSVREAMNPYPEAVPENLTLRSFTERLSRSKHNSFPVVDEKGALTGVISSLDYQSVLFDENLRDLVIVKELASPGVVTVSTDDTLYTALQRIASKDFSMLPVVASKDPAKLVGILSRRDIIGAYEKAVIKKSVLK
jgi:chloride channel protein, CIC family